MTDPNKRLLRAAYLAHAHGVSRGGVMDEKKKQALEKAGWNVGTVDEFLDEISPKPDRAQELAQSLHQKLQPSYPDPWPGMEPFAAVIRQREQELVEEIAAWFDGVAETIIQHASQNDLNLAWVSSRRKDIRERWGSK